MTLRSADCSMARVLRMVADEYSTLSTGHPGSERSEEPGIYGHCQYQIPQVRVHRFWARGLCPRPGTTSVRGGMIASQGLAAFSPASRSAGFKLVTKLSSQGSLSPAALAIRCHFVAATGSAGGPRPAPRIRAH